MINLNERLARRACGGFLATLDARTGKLLKRDRVPGGSSYYSSPVCVGKHVLVRVNGVTTADQVWEPLLDEGVLAFQMHYARGTRGVQFRGSAVKELKPALGTAVGAGSMRNS